MFIRVGENAKIVITFQVGTTPVSISAASFLTARVLLTIARKPIAYYEMGDVEFQRVGNNLVLFIKQELPLFPGKLIGRFVVTRTNTGLLGGVQQDVALVELVDVKNR